MSTVKAINLQHPTSSNANIVLDTSGNIIANGKIGIGTTTPTHNLSISSSSANATMSVTSTSGGGQMIIQAYAGTIGSIGSTNNIPIEFLTNNTRRMYVDTNGYVTKPYQPSVIATRSSHVTTTMSPIIFDNIVNQTGNCYNASTGLFTAPVTGWYNVSHCFIFWNMGSATYTWIYKNGSTYGPTSLGSYGSFTGSYAGQSGSLMVYASTGDTLGIGCTHNGTHLHGGYIGLSITLMS